MFTSLVTDAYTNGEVKNTMPLPASLASTRHSLMFHSTHYRSFRGQFYGPDDQTNSVIALKDND